MASFTERRKALFDVLKAAEDSNPPGRRSLTSSKRESPYVSPRYARELRSQTKAYRFKKSIFLRAEAPIGQCLRPGTVPDYHKNPDKWTYYNLEDVGDVTEESNARAAAACLREIRTDKMAKEGEGNLDTVPDDGKIVFKLPIRIPSDEDPGRVTYRNSKLVMPEYTIGKDGKSKKRERLPKTSEGAERSEVELKLDHLLDDEESEN